MTTTIMHKYIPVESNPVHKLLEMPKGGGECAQLVWSLFLSLSLSLLPSGWTTGYVGEATESHVHEVVLRRQGDGNSSATATPTTTTCS